MIPFYLLNTITGADRAHPISRKHQSCLLSRTLRDGRQRWARV